MTKTCGYITQFAQELSVRIKRGACILDLKSDNMPLIVELAVLKNTLIYNGSGINIECYYTNWL